MAIACLIMSYIPSWILANALCFKKLEALIEDQLRDGLGHQKVSAGEYELFNSFDSSKAIILSDDQSLTPGMAITMAIVYGYYESGPLSHCPRPDCRTNRVMPNEAGGMSWYVVSHSSTLYQL